MLSCWAKAQSLPSWPGSSSASAPCWLCPSLLPVATWTNLTGQGPSAPRLPGARSQSKGPHRAAGERTMGGDPGCAFCQEDHRKDVVLSSTHHIRYVMSACPIFGDVKSDYLVGLPWWLSGKEPACQFRGRRFHPWSRKIPHAAEQQKLVPRNWKGHALELVSHSY